MMQRRIHLHRWHIIFADRENRKIFGVEFQSLFGVILYHAPTSKKYIATSHDAVYFLLNL
jgi:hypothetical protein